MIRLKTSWSSPISGNQHAEFLRVNFPARPEKFKEFQDREMNPICFTTICLFSEVKSEQRDSAFHRQQRLWSRSPQCRLAAIPLVILVVSRAKTISNFDCDRRLFPRLRFQSLSHLSPKFVPKDINFMSAELRCQPNWSDPWAHFSAFFNFSNIVFFQHR